MTGSAAAASGLPEPDVAAALRKLGLRARSWTPVTTLGGGTQRVSYRVALDDGRTVKVRRVLDDARSAQTLRIRKQLVLPGIPSLLHHWGPVWVEAWVEGRALTDAAPDRRDLEQAAGILASLHRVDRLGSEPLRGTCDTESWRAVSEERLERMKASGVLGARSAAGLRAALRRADPGRVASGLTHGDFVPDNFVVDPAGQLHVIDNETLGSSPLDLDLATTWSRWPMPAADFEHFVDAYARRAGRRPADLGWWRIVAVTKSVAVRIERYPATAAPAIARLRDLARALGAARAASGRRRP